MKEGISNFVFMVNNNNEVALVFEKSSFVNIENIEVLINETDLFFKYQNKKIKINLEPVQFRKVISKKSIFLATMLNDVEIGDAVEAVITRC